MKLDMSRVRVEVLGFSPASLDNRVRVSYQGTDLFEEIVMSALTILCDPLLYNDQIRKIIDRWERLLESPEVMREWEEVGDLTP